MPSPLEIGRAVFEEIRESFPDLQMQMDPAPEHVDLEMVIPAQLGLLSDICLNLQNIDELHISATDFWLEWFPCTDPSVVARYLEAVVGLLDGSYRLLHYRWRGRLLRTDLQKPDGDEWETIGRYYSGLAILPVSWFRPEASVLQNVAAE